MAKSALGKGLGALIGTRPAPPPRSADVPVAEANGEVHLDDVHQETTELTALAELSDGGDDEIELSGPDEFDAD